MKHSKFAIGVLMIFVLLACSGEKNKIPADVVSNPRSASGKATGSLPVIEFEKDLHDFGKLVQGEVVSYNFTFTNTGSSDLLISQVQTSCGCTVTSYPKEAIKPGAKGAIKVTFDSSGRKGVQNKSVTVVSNCQPNSTTVRIKAQVMEP